MVRTVSLTLVALLTLVGVATAARSVFWDKTYRYDSGEDKDYDGRMRGILLLYIHAHEPLYDPKQREIASTYKIEDNLDKYGNAKAAQVAVDIIKKDRILPRGVPFSILDDYHRFEAVTYFNIMYSAKDVDTLYNTAVYLRNIVNEYLFVYIFTVVLYHRKDTEKYFVPHFHEIFPYFFNNGQVMAAAQRLSIQKERNMEHYPATYMRFDDYTIKWNATIWPYFSQDMCMAYYHYDFGLNDFYYYDHIRYPFWLGGEVTLNKDRRGERFWFNHKQFLARYYMERLSNHLGEVPDLGLDSVETGYNEGLMYPSGVPFPVRPAHFSLEQPQFKALIEDIVEYERRVREAIERGYVLTPWGERVNLRDPKAIDELGNLIEANYDSPNSEYYKDFISMWKKLLGNSISNGQYHNNVVPLVLPSALELPQTALRDPAFYMIWKRVMKLFSLWQSTLPPYTHQELTVPDVTIEDVLITNLTTRYYYDYMALQQSTYWTELDVTPENFMKNKRSILVEQPYLVHDGYKFAVNVTVRSGGARNVSVRYFLAPKYDSAGREVPLHDNCDNFYLFGFNVYELEAGKNYLDRFTVDNFHTASEYVDIESAFEDVTKRHTFPFGWGNRVDSLPYRSRFPKGRVGGMAFKVLIYISEYRPAEVPYATGWDPAVSSSGTGLGARRFTREPLGFPVDRPLHQWQVDGLQNIWIGDMNIYHNRDDSQQPAFF